MIGSTGITEKKGSPNVQVPERLMQDLSKVKKSAKDMEGVFTLEMFKAMRETVPEGGAVTRSEGEQMFTSMLDEKMSGGVGSEAGHWEHGLARSIFHQLARGVIAQSGVGPEVADAALKRLEQPHLSLEGASMGSRRLTEVAEKAAQKGALELRGRLMAHEPASTNLNTKLSTK